MNLSSDFFKEKESELNISGKFLIKDNIAFVIYGFSSSLITSDFLKINAELKRLLPFGSYSFYNFDSFNMWIDSYCEVEKAKHIVVFKNSNLMFYLLKFKNN